MKWRTLDIGLYLKEKQYIDTVIIPLVPIDWGNDMKRTVTEGEFITTLAEEVEHQLRGRVLLSQAFTYLKNESIEDRLNRLQVWENDIKKGNVNFVYYVTSDVDWKQVEDSLDWLTWFAAIPLDQMDKKYQETIIKDHVDLMLHAITEKWQLSNFYNK